MSDKCFIDSNILLYVFMIGDNEKSIIAEKLLKDNLCIISSQVVGEVCNNLRKKSDYTEAKLLTVMRELYSEFWVQPIVFPVYEKAVQSLEKYSLSFWDSVIVASALESDDRILYSEDLHSGLKIDNIIINNPFHK